jgi:type II pantothenate kinase
METVTSVAVFPLLADPSGYRACATDLLANDAARAYWINLFETHFQVQLDAAATIGVSETGRQRAAETMKRELAALREDPARHDRLDILVLDSLRTKALRAGGIHDEFRSIKQRENDAAMRALPDRLAALASLDGSALIEELMRGMLAGNLFDMGVPASADRFAGATIPFDQVLGDVPSRPWRYDDLDAFVGWLDQAAARKAIIFADNAGADVVLGVLPLARHLVQRGMEVVVAANEQPSLNDITHSELAAVRSRAAAVDPVYASEQLRTVSSGCAAPLIDLSAVGGELSAAAEDADLIVLDGMGRAIESNWTATITVPCLRVAMLKDPQVACSVGGELYDAVCRFDEPS